MYTFATPVGRQAYRVLRSLTLALEDLFMAAGVSQICVTNRKFFCRHMLAQQSKSENGVLAQLVERLNGIEEVRGSNPLGSRNPATVRISSARRDENSSPTPLRDSASIGRSCFVEPDARRDNS